MEVFLLPAYLPSVLVSKCGKFCLYPDAKKLPSGKMRYGVGPLPTKLKWTDEDFRELLPLNETTRKYYFECAVYKFYIDGCYCKFQIQSPFG
jgi:hypothetical protein